MKIYRFLPLMVLAFILLVSCGGEETPTPAATDAPATEQVATTVPVSGDPIEQNATIDSVQVQVLESFPVQIDVRARGELPNGCTTITNVSSAQSGNQFNIIITTVQQIDPNCSETAVPFEEVISLDVAGLPAATYAVDVNGIRGSFTLEVDNVPGAQPTAVPSPTPAPTDEPADSNMALVNGRVWHDLCAIAGGEEDEEATPSEGCIANVNEGFQANGLLENNEPGLPNIIVNLGAGPCPSAGFATTVTDEDGDYVFIDLSAGTYCVSIDATGTDNVEQLIPGGWTFPEIDPTVATISTEVVLADGEVFTDVNFGWDHQFLPAPEVDLETCSNSIEFVEDLNIPDNTLFAPETSFEKGWRLRNNGTCPWTTSYSLVFATEDQMSAPDSIPLTSVIVPGQTVDLTVPFIAPTEFGTYRSNWVLSNADGEQFGIDGFVDEAFWVQIEVGTPDATPVPNSAAIGGVVWEDFCRLNSEGEPSVGCEEIEDSGFFRADGSLNFSERRLVGVTLTLSEDACNPDGSVLSGDIVATTTTDEQGLYRFSDLDEGVYCITIDALGDDNLDLLIPGDWTWPAVGVGRQGSIVTVGEERLEVDFGWDFDD